MLEHDSIHPLHAALVITKEACAVKLVSFSGETCLNGKKMQDSYPMDVKH